MVESVKEEMGDRDVTTGTQITCYLDKYYTPAIYRGICLDNDIPALHNGQFCINNFNRHWTAVFRKNNKLYEFDSYNRDMLGRKFINRRVNKRDVQGYGGIDDGDCGQRTCAIIRIDFPQDK